MGVGEGGDRRMRVRESGENWIGTTEVKGGNGKGDKGCGEEIN